MNFRSNTCGMIQGANQAFVDVSGCTESPQVNHLSLRLDTLCFKLLWDEVQAGNEIIAFVKNACKDSRIFAVPILHVALC